MSPDRPIFKTPEVPKGEDLARKTIQFTQKALVETYPMLENEPFARNLPTKQTIRFASKDEMMEWERKRRPENDNQMYQTLYLAGIPKDQLDSIYFRSVNSLACVDFSGNPEVLINNLYFEKLLDNDPTTRAFGALTIGQVLIQTYLFNAPTPLELPAYPWKRIMEEQIDKVYLDPLQKQYKENINQRAMNRARGSMIRAMNSDAQLVAQGAKVHLLRPGQNPKTAEVSIGSNFQIGIMEYLSKEPILKLFNYINHEFLPKEPQPSIPKTATQARAETIFKEMDVRVEKKPTASGKLLEPPRSSGILFTESGNENGKPSQITLRMGNNSEDRQLVLEQYMASLIPLYYFWERHDANLWSYPA